MQTNQIQPIDLPIVFILAKGRSGTTLLQTMLDAHPHIIAPFESRFVVHLKNRYQNVTCWNSKIKSRFIIDVLKEQKIELFWELDVQLLESRIKALPENTNYGLVCKQVYSSYKSWFDKGKPKIIVDKNPIHSLLIPLIKKVFPKALFVHVIRDYRASCNSTFRLQPNKNMRELGYRWLMANLEIEKEKKKRALHTLKYEDLVKNPNLTLTNLMNFMGLSFHPNSLQYHKNIDEAYEEYILRSPNERASKIRKQGAISVHKNLSRPLDSTINQSWKRELNNNQIRQLDQYCGAYASKYNYLENKENVIPKIPLDIRLIKIKLQLYYRLPIFIRELKSKPNLALIKE